MSPAGQLQTCYLAPSSSLHLPAGRGFYVVGRDSKAIAGPFKAQREADFKLIALGGSP